MLLLLSSPFISGKILVLQRGYTPLHIAAKVGNTGTVKALLQAGAKVDVTDKVVKCMVINHAHSFELILVVLVKEEDNSINIVVVLAIRYR